MPDDLPPSSPALQACPGCGAMIDISKEAPLSEVRCQACGTAMRARTQFNNFMLEAEIGIGGMGVVYRALDVNLNRLVALKVVLKEYSSDPAYHAKFEHEARITAQVNHPHVVKVYSFGSDHGQFYIAMELVDRGSLDELINHEGRIPEARALETGIQIAQGLNAALKRGLIHRDVKPGNILFADDHTAKIVDFGLALPMEHGAKHRKPGSEVWG
ncbi:MAG TPA: serine/threonine-protein kinase, partial [Chthoniobacteraceae bacterium]|nr:serine/threonine-protein kinase [Chthoniobacteraceae bacterium]